MWLRIDDQFTGHPKVVGAGLVAGWLDLEAMEYCSKYLTDGFISTVMAKRLANTVIDFASAEFGNNAVSNVLTPEILIERLVGYGPGPGLWEVCEGGYMVHDYLDYNPTAESVRADRAKNAERQAKYVARQVNNAVSNPVSNAITNTVPSPFKSLVEESQLSIERFLDAGVCDFSNHICLISSPRIQAEIEDRLETLFERKAFSWWAEAIKIAEDANARDWRYVRKVIDNHLISKTPPGTPRQPNSKNTYGFNRSNGHTPVDLSEGYTASGFEPEDAPLAQPPSEAEQLWQQTLAFLRMQKIGGETFAGSKAINLTGDCLTIQVADQGKLALIEQRFLPRVNAALTQAAGRPLTVRIECGF